MEDRRYPNKFKAGNSFGSLRRDRQPDWLNNRLLNKARAILFPTKKGRKPGFKHSEETKEKLRQSTIKQLEKQRIFCDTKPERMVENWLLFNDILYIKQYATGKGLSDFWLPETNTIIEVYGDYWHNLPEYIKRDRKKNKFLEENDYIVNILWEKEIKENLSGCLKLIA